MVLPRPAGGFKMNDASVFRAIGRQDGLVDQVVTRIEDLILKGDLKPGVRLPPERDLAEQMGVSRTVIREAVRVLGAKGLLVTKHGIGTLVQKPDTEQVGASLSERLRLHGFTVEDVYQVRSLLEVENARLAAANASSEDLADLERLTNELEAASDPVELAAADAAFHNAVARATHNSLLVVLLNSMSGLMNDIRLSVNQDPSLARKSIHDHRVILEQLHTRDAEQAQAAMLRHIQNSREIQKQLLKGTTDSLSMRADGNHKKPHRK